MLRALTIAALAAVSFVTIASATIARAQDNDTLRVGMSGGYFPFTFVQQDKRKPEWMSSTSQCRFRV